AGPLQRAWRGCRRHPREVAILGLAVLLLAGGAAAAWWADRQQLQLQWQQEREARQKDGIRQAVEATLHQLPQFYEHFLFDQAREALARAEEKLRCAGACGKPRRTGTSRPPWTPSGRRSRWSSGAS